MGGSSGGGNPPAIQIGGCFDAGTAGDGGDMADTIDASVAAKRQTMPDKRRFAAALVGGGVRRLTPTETERLQGFPDGWTCLCGCEPYSTAACRCPDGPRYAAMGNAVAVPCVEWIARRLLRA